MRTVAFAIFAALALNVIKPLVALGQSADSQRNGCSASEILKPTKTVSGTYTEEATKKNVEGTVVVCVTVDGNGRVIDVRPLSGPSELLQPSMDAARRWRFEAPRKAPASSTLEMKYSLTKPCPEGKGFDAGDVVVTIVLTDAEKVGDLKILGILLGVKASKERSVHRMRPELFGPERNGSSRCRPSITSRRSSTTRTCSAASPP